MYVKQNYICPQADFMVWELPQHTLTSLSMSSDKVYDYSEEASDVINFGEEE